MIERVQRRAARVGRGWRSKPVLAFSGALIVLGAATFAGKSFSGETRVAESGDDPWMAALRSFWSFGTGGSSYSGSPRRRYSTSGEREERGSRSARRTLPSSRSERRVAKDFGGSGTYRTVCVRLCDGYYWPISFATDASNFYRDEKICERSCSSPSRLYTYPNPSGTPEEMTDVSGVPYSKLTTAFLYRSEYVAACKCKPDPWEQEALDRHRLYALEARLRKGDKKAAAQITALKAEMSARQRVTKAGGFAKSSGNAGGLIDPSGNDKGVSASQVKGAVAKTPEQQPAGATLKVSPAITSGNDPSDSSPARHQ